MADHSQVPESSDPHVHAASSLQTRRRGGEERDSDCLPTRGLLALGAGVSSCGLFLGSLGRYWVVVLSRSFRTQDSFMEPSSAAFLNVEIRSGQAFASSNAHCLMTKERYMTFPSNVREKCPLISAMSLVIVPENTNTWLPKNLCANLSSLTILRKCLKFLTMHAPLSLFCSWE